MEEPSVLDYIKSLIKGKPLHINFAGEAANEPVQPEPAEELKLEPAPEAQPDEMPDIPQKKLRSMATASLLKFPWRIAMAFVIALIAQTLLEPARREIVASVVLYGISALLAVWSLIANEWKMPEMAAESPENPEIKLRLPQLGASIPVLLFSFVMFSGNRFSVINLTVWIIGLIFMILAFTQPSAGGATWKERRAWLKNPSLTFKVTPWTILVLLVTAVVIFFRFYRLDSVLGEMFSDHAEKLLDVGDILNGQYSIFFPRNTGREAFQMYWTALVSIVCGTGLSYMSLKIGTVLIGLIPLPWIYKLGKDLGNKWVGLGALLLCGMAYWPNVISRVGLRFPLYPAFTAPALYYLIRGIRQSKLKDMILSGIFLGIGLHGYSPYRIIPIVFVFLILMYLLHPVSKGKRKFVLTSFVILALISFIVFLPLFRVALEMPEMFASRALSRLSETETAFSAPPVQIFFSNLWKSMIMFFYDNGGIWVHSIPGHPALDYVTAALFFLGMIGLVIRYIRKRDWVDLFMLVSVPLLMLPSILSIAFPSENPSLNRSGAAIIPVFIIAAFGLVGIFSTLYESVRGKFGKGLVVIYLLVVLGLSATDNFDLVFNKFDKQFMQGAWNTSDIGHVIRGFVDSTGTRDTAYVIPYPYWVDTRLVGINAGFPEKDYALSAENIESTLTVSGAKLFIVKQEDVATLNRIKALYPENNTYLYNDQYEGKDFWIIYIPAN